MQESDLAAVGADLDKDFATNEYRRVVASDAAVKTRQPGALDDTIDTPWNDASDAPAELDALFALISEDRDLYRVSATGIQFLLRAGRTIRLQHPRFGLVDGREYVILGIAENVSIGMTQL